MRSSIRAVRKNNNVTCQTDRKAVRIEAGLLQKGNLMYYCYINNNRLGKNFNYKSSFTGCQINISFLHLPLKFILHSTENDVLYTRTHDGTRWRGWLRHCATSRKVSGSIADDIIFP